MNETTICHVKRSYKDTLFRMIFSEKDKLLSLYNTVSRNHYADPEALEIVTLENAIYMNMKNDLAFVVECSLHLYEYQSTYSPNMPIRNLFYIARKLEIMLNHRSLCSTKPVLFPEPCFIVFFNGTDQPWSQKILKLSECYQRKTDNPKLELLVTMLNINLDRNDDLLEKCPTLLEYMQYVNNVRTYSALWVFRRQ